MSVMIAMLVSMVRAVTKAKNVPVRIPAEYSDYTNVFLSDSATVLPKHTGINNHPIGLIDSSHPMTFQVICRRSNIVHLQKGR